MLDALLGRSTRQNLVGAGESDLRSRNPVLVLWASRRGSELTRPQETCCYPWQRAECRIRLRSSEASPLTTRSVGCRVPVPTSRASAKARGAGVRLVAPKQTCWCKFAGTAGPAAALKTYAPQKTPCLGANAHRQGLLIAHGSTVPRPQLRARPSSLTPRQAHVVAAVTTHQGRGLTSLEVAPRQFPSRQPTSAAPAAQLI